MPNTERVMRAAFQSDENLRKTLKEVLEELGLSAREFSRESGIPPSTLYKILSGHREPNITTLRQIVKTLRSLEGSEGNFIAVIAARPVLDKISEKKMRIGEKLLTLREYSATTIEEAIRNLREATELYLEEFRLPKTTQPIITTFEAKSAA
jgi:predicted transcriptional regulator